MRERLKWTVLALACALAAGSLAPDSFAYGKSHSRSKQTARTQVDASSSDPNAPLLADRVVVRKSERQNRVIDHDQEGSMDLSGLWNSLGTIAALGKAAVGAGIDAAPMATLAFTLIKEKRGMTAAAQGFWRQLQPVCSPIRGPGGCETSSPGMAGH